MSRRTKFLILSYLICGSAYAETEFRVGGFGTLGIIHSSNHLVDFTTDAKPDGAGHTRNIDAETDTLAAIQVDAIFNDQLSATIQVLSHENNGSGNFDPVIEWANLKWKITPNLSIHLGRMGLPAFMVSDYRLVNYANVWARPPNEVYIQAPISHLDGISARYQHPLGDGIFNTEGSYYSISSKSFQNTTVSGGGSMLWNGSYEEGALTARLFYARFNLSNPDGSTPFLNVLANVPGSGELADHFFAINEKGKYYSLGLLYDPGKYFIQGEYAYRNMDKGFITTTYSWYGLVGIRRGKWSPYFMYSDLRSIGPFSDPVASAMANGALGPSLISFGYAISQVIAQRNQSQSTAAIGVRYDLMKNIALKAQYDHIQLKDGSYGLYTYPRSQTTPAGNANVISLNLDFVF